MDPEFDELKREFLEEASTKVAEIERLLAEGGIGNDSAKERALYLAHQLKGAGGSYGFTTISTEAAGLESDLEKAPGNVDQESLERRLANLQGVIATRKSELAPQT